MNDLITLEEYKAYKQIGNPEKDSVYSVLISSVSSLIKSYCGQTFIDYWDTPITEVFTVKKGMNAVILNESPIRLLSGVNSEGVDITPLTYVDADTGIVYHATEFTPGVDILSITYTGGYPETPSDLKLAAFELVDYYANNEHTARKQFGGSSVEYHPDKNNWPFHIRSILDTYRDV